jgi:hypothetical protein
VALLSENKSARRKLFLPFLQICLLAGQIVPVSSVERAQPRLQGRDAIRGKDLATLGIQAASLHEFRQRPGKRHDQDVRHLLPANELRSAKQNVALA